MPRPYFPYLVIRRATILIGILFVNMCSSLVGLRVLCLKSNSNYEEAERFANQVPRPNGPRAESYVGNVPSAIMRDVSPI